MTNILGPPVLMGLLSLGLCIVLLRRGNRWAVSLSVLTWCLLFAIWMIWEFSRPTDPQAADSILPLIVTLWAAPLLLSLLIALVVDLVRASRARARDGSSPLSAGTVEPIDDI